MNKLDRPTKAERNAILNAGQGNPQLGIFLNDPRIAAQPRLAEALEGIWCGREGRETIDIPNSGSVIVVQWYYGKVEVAYIS